jgi:AcrR family transcriptional regulator
MAKTGRKGGGVGKSTNREDIRQRLITAAFETLRDRGFAETSARAIAEAGGLNQAQIFYYFGSVNGLLVAALERSSLEQLDAYRRTVGTAETVSEIFVEVQARLEEDLASGHVKVLAELIGAGTADPELRTKVVELFTPWIELTEQTVRQAVDRAGMSGLVPAEQVAYGAVCLFLGAQQLVTLTGDAKRVLEMFTAAQQTATMLEAVLLPGLARERE